MDCIVHRILQARIVEWVAVPFSRGSSQPRDWTQVSHIVGRFFTSQGHTESEVARPMQSDSITHEITIFVNYQGPSKLNKPPSS